MFIAGLVITGSGCQDDIFEIKIGDENAVIQQEVNNIGFEFCLLNEQGEPATVFKEGENFTFQFLIKNNRTESLPFYDYGFYTSTDFFTVRSNRENYGKPFDFLHFSMTKEARFIFPQSYVGFTVPWHEERNEFRMMHGYFEGLNKPYRKKGKYFTRFSYNFTFGMPDKKPKIEPGMLHFKINFEIE